MVDEFSRSRILLGTKSMDKLKTCRIAVFGVGGVGGFAVEALARTGVGSFVLVDNDTVSLTNLNRQIIATRTAIGRPKIEVMKERILDINPYAQVELHQTFYLPDNHDNLLDDCDYVVDAIDTVTAKIALVLEAKERGIPIISCMGTGNKLDPTRFEIADISDTSVCPLCRAMRQQLRKKGIEHLKVVYSQEESVPREENPELSADSTKRQTPGSVAYVPSVAGLILASEVIRDLTENLRPEKLD